MRLIEFLGQAGWRFFSLCSINERENNPIKQSKPEHCLIWFVLFLSLFFIVGYEPEALVLHSFNPIKLVDCLSFIPAHQSIKERRRSKISLIYSSEVSEWVAGGPNKHNQTIQFQFNFTCELNGMNWRAAHQLTQ